MLLTRAQVKKWFFDSPAVTNAVDVAAIRLPLPVREGFAGSIKGFAYEPGHAEFNQLAPEDALPPEPFLNGAIAAWTTTISTPRARTKIC